MLHIADVELTADPAAFAGSIDTPVAGWRSGGHAFTLGGWVLGLSQPCRSVEVVSAGTVVRTVPVDTPRPDIASIPAFEAIPHAARSGFVAGVGLLGLPDRFELDIRGVGEDSRSWPLGTIRGRRTPIAPPTADTLRPIMVTCLGRTGTTLLLDRLGRHPDVVIEPRYPHETRCASYWMHLLKVLGEPGPVVPPATWFARFGETDKVFPIPFAEFMDDGQRDWLADEYVERLASFARSCLDGFYGQIDREGGQGPAQCFAEKQYPGLTADILDEVYPDRSELLSVRDPRDMLISILDFMAGGHSVLQHQDTDPPEQLTAQLTIELAALVDRRDRLGTRAHVVRYEDLVQRPEPTIAALLDHCDLVASDAVLDRMTAIAPGDAARFDSHRTATDLEASVSRWHHDANDRVRRYWSPELEDLTVALGYPPST